VGLTGGFPDQYVVEFYIELDRMKDEELGQEFKIGLGTAADTRGKIIASRSYERCRHFQGLTCALTEPPNSDILKNRAGR
jgi:hypothetical protein